MTDSSTADTTTEASRPLRVAIIGAGPAGLTLASALSKRSGVAVEVFERGANHAVAPEYNPNRSYTIDVT